MNILVTGGCGFIGSHFIRMLIRHRPEVSVHNIDKLTYAGTIENLRAVGSNPRYSFCAGSIEDEGLIEMEVRRRKYDAIVNFAAESHVDNSLGNPYRFIDTNLKGTTVLLQAVRRYNIGRFLQVSTDEVYGSVNDGPPFKEDAPLLPGNPYSVTKAAADMMVQAYARSFGLNTLITRASNTYGPTQFPEKFIPVIITKALKNEKIPVYGKGLQIRDWLYVEDHCRGILAALERGRVGHIYNLGGGNERPNLEIVKEILRILGKDGSLIEFVADRPGHDMRYSIDTSKAKTEIGWEPVKDFREGLWETIEWYQYNAEWIEHALQRKP